MRTVLAVASLLAVSAAPAWAGLPRQVVPEPASMALMGGGLAALAFVAWRRGKNRKP